MAAGSITADKLAANAVTAGKVAAGAITAGTLAAGVITATELAANSVIAGKIAAGAVSATEIAAGAIVTAKLAVGAVVADNIAAGAIVAGKIAAGAITADMIATGGLRGININSAAFATIGSFLTSSVSAGATIIDVHNTVDFPSSGSGWIINNNSAPTLITYTGKTAITLTGCYIPSGDFLANSAIVPYGASIVIDRVSNRLIGYGDRGDGVYRYLFRIGVIPGNPYAPIAKFGDIECVNTALEAVSKTRDAAVFSSIEEHAIVISSSGKGDIRLENRFAVPVDRTAGSFCYSNGYLCWADGTHWYRASARTQLT
jgi:hypothetical protein